MMDIIRADQHRNRIGMALQGRHQIIGVVFGQGNPERNATFAEPVEERVVGPGAQGQTG